MHVEHEINHGSRGKSHTSPEKEIDVSRLQAKYHDAKAHVPVPGRLLASKDRFADIMEQGSKALTMDEGTSVGCSAAAGFRRL